MAAPPSTLTEALARRLADAPDEVASYLVGADGQSQPVTFARLMKRAMAFAARFGSPEAPASLVAVSLYHSLDLHAAFLGALWAGHIPTMLAPPSPRMEPRKYAESFRRVIEHVRPRFLVTSTALLDKLDPAVVDTDAGTFIAAETVTEGPDVPPHPARPDDVALLQHSSGTTGLQKGIALSHGAVLRHNDAYCAHLGIGRGDVIASWLPLYHDMGFIAAFVLPLCQRVPFVEISPFDWVLRPALLLEKIHEHRATLCWLPNFAFSFMAQSIGPDRLASSVDLSSVRAFVNSSEPVTDAAVSAFVARFAAHGVHRGQMTASYAMAENVYAVSQSAPGAYRALRVQRRALIDQHRILAAAASDDAVTVVSSGPPVASTEVLVLDDADRPVPDEVVGQVALRGQHAFSGYFQRDDLTAAAMTADGWYRTGDLGFLSAGEVFVTGRKKDLIIIQGRNFYPGDIEDAAARVPLVRPGRVVAFGLPDEANGTEKLIILAEAEAPEGLAPPEAQARARQVALEIRKTIAQQFDCTPADVRVFLDRWLVKSTSGKLARNDNRAKYLELVAKRGAP